MKRESRIGPPVPQAESPLRHLPLVDLLVDTKTELLDRANFGNVVIHPFEPLTWPNR